MSLFRTAGLTKRYGGITALDGLTVDVPRGLIGLVGANGAGKTTLFRLLLGLARPTEGTVEVCGRAVADEVGGKAAARVLRGATVAPAFGACAFAWSLLARFTFHVPPNSTLWGDFTLTSVPIEALVWPVLISAGAGIAGGLRSARELPNPSDAARLGFGAWAGGLRMLVTFFTLGGVRDTLLAAHPWLAG